MYDQEFGDNFDFFETLKSSLDEAVAYSRGEPNNCRVTIRSTEDAEYKAYLARKRQSTDDSAVERL